jgi:hypothetical protein
VITRSGKTLTVLDLEAAYRAVVERYVSRTTNPRNGGKVHRGKTRFPGIDRDAKALNVDRTTLYRALTGAWKLPGLLRRYQELRRGKE